MNLNFTNKVVLVTGASVGIGESTALVFAKQGAKLALVARNEANLRAVAKRCEQQKGVKPLVIVADLGTDAGVEKTVKDTLAHFGRLDVLVNNAAIGRDAAVEEMEMSIFDNLFNVNVRSVYNLTRLLLPALLESKGNIVNVSSVAGIMALPTTSVYSMTKASLDIFTRILAVEVAGRGVRVNTVSPGITISEFMKRMNGYTEQEYQDWLKRALIMIPMRKPCEAEDIAKTIVYLASDDARLVTGTMVEVDGGMKLGSLRDAVYEKQ